jgi:AGZA family xanthine/uracil permease-like MFS transporter
LLFVLALFIAPVVGAIPAAATAPALIVVGSMMVSVVGEIAWNDPEVAIPAFLTITGRPRARRPAAVPADTPAPDVTVAAGQA